MIPACQSPGPSLDTSYLGHFDEKRGFTNQNIEGLDSCFKYMNSWSDYALYRQGKNNRGNFGTFVLIVVVLIVIIVLLRKGDDEEEVVEVDERVEKNYDHFSASTSISTCANGGTADLLSTTCSTTDVHATTSTTATKTGIPTTSFQHYY